ncbi:uncharacterized protein LOC128263879 [Drosophila gunungcola]|uniref:uncharacterized protein LOC128263879 n=1 Tax=Drosophila gunungcola TaxID=103775 RepID=UPI0022DFF6BC|nr:uncharacterized protein LOC128263879 [Drosophila gunungcola]
MLELLQAKYEHCYEVYESCTAKLSEQVERVKTQTANANSNTLPIPFSSGCRLPPCDTEVFEGDYLKWPTFRDLFTAVYVNNPRLTAVEKLFHLNAKTSGEAKAIVSKYPLTNEGFDSAWEALRDRFENKRLLVNSQLKLLFNLGSVNPESGQALKDLQSTIQGCLIALAHSNISTENWDCLLVFLCASRLPKLTLSLWEQSLSSKSDIPTWDEMNTFLSERYRTLEAIEEMKPSHSNHSTAKSQSVPRKLNSFEAKVVTKPKNCDLCSKETVQGAATGLENPPSVQNYFATGARAVLLGTAIIDICHLGTNYRARALIDSGSEATFISERLFNLIKLPFRLIQAQVSGLNQTVSAQAPKLCHFSIRAPNKPGLQLETTAYVLPELAGMLPSYPIPRDGLVNLPAIQLADPTFLESSQIDVLIGADILPSVWLSGTRTNICGSLLGQETIFGWVLTGPVSNASVQKRVAAFTTQITETSDRVLEKLLTKFWEVENIPTRRVKESDSYCESNFLQTTTRDASGKYVVTLPFREPENFGSKLGHSRSIALAQLLRNENRLKRDFPLKEQYDSVIQEYLDLGHMREVPPSYDTPNYYLPHHAVIKPESTTTKLRVVFTVLRQSSTWSHKGLSV